MPKQKSHKSAKKRFKVTAGGKVLRKHAMASHLLGKKSAKRKRLFGRLESVHPADLKPVRRLLGKR
jgi:large subunit ribosomal protein L35